MRLASDCAQLEFALSLILGPTGFSSAGPTLMLFKKQMAQTYKCGPCRKCADHVASVKDKTTQGQI